MHPNKTSQLLPTFQQCVFLFSSREFQNAEWLVQQGGGCCASNFELPSQSSGIVGEREQNCRVLMQLLDRANSPPSALPRGPRLVTHVWSMIYEGWPNWQPRAMQIVWW